MNEKLDLQQIPHALLDGVEINDEIADKLRFAPSLGFCALEGESGLQVAGFHAGPIGVTELTPAIRLQDRAAQSQTLNDNAKGVGLLMGNSRQSIVRPSDLGREREVALWLTPPLNAAEITDVSHRDPTKLPVMATGIVRHAGLIALDRLKGTEVALGRIESRYRNANLAIMDPAPIWLFKQRGTDYPAAPKWAIWRDVNRRPLQKIGHLSES